MWGGKAPMHYLGALATVWLLPKRQVLWVREAEETPTDTSRAAIQKMQGSTDKSKSAGKPSAFFCLKASVLNELTA